jgi:DNA polymerase III delta subunit
MYQKDLDALIANGKHKDVSSFLFFGQCRYLSNLYCEKIIADFAGESDVSKMYFDEYDFESAKS